MRPGLLKTRHLEIYVHIKFEENGAWKGLQTVVQILGQKLKKKKKKKKTKILKNKKKNMKTSVEKIEKQ